MDPSLAHFEHTGLTAEGAESITHPLSGETAAEREAHSPPPSLIPRLHAITAHILPHSCPLLPRDMAPPINQSGIV